ncbi:MAG: discoidin domain-containing protein, partial [Armatimonadota bacterium]
MTISRFALLVCIITVATSAVLADTYVARTNVPIRIALPDGSGGDMKVFIKARGGEWQAAEYELEENRIILSPNPGQLGGTEIFMVINPPADLVLDDSKPPLLLGVKADGKPLVNKNRQDLGRMLEPPATLTFGVADRENALDLQSVQVTFDGSQLPAERVSIEQISRRQAKITADIAVDEYGTHEVQLRVADRSPETHELQVQVAFEKIAGDNYVRPESGKAEVRVDSYFANYPSLEPLTDGYKILSGAGAGNDVTWASAENEQPHWIEVSLPEEKTLSEVTVYWAYSGSTFYTSQQVMVQVPENDGWRTVYKTPEDSQGAQRSSTYTFEPVQTQQFRVYQPPGGGPSSRPNLMWVAEV